MNEKGISVHPYHRAKAEQVFIKAGGDPANAGPLALWAEQVRNAIRANMIRDESGRAPVPHSVLVAEDGSLVAEAEMSPKAPAPADVQAIYITKVLHPDLRDRRWPESIMNREHGLACGAAARILGQPVIVVRHSEMTGPAPRECV